MENRNNHEKKSSFAGFLKGYKARNIQSIERSLNYKVKEIHEMINGMIDLLKKDQKNADLVYSLKRTSNFLKEKDVPIISKMNSFGEAFKSNMQILNIEPEMNSDDLKEKERKIIFNFIELAKMSEDKRLINLAIEIGEAFSY